MEIIIDSREHALVEVIKQKQCEDRTLCKHIEIKTKSLALGDIHIVFNDATILIIERKTIPDLASSITDGRYREQSHRLSHNSIPNHDIMYIIEGSIYGYKSKYNRITPKAIYSAMIVLQYFKGFSIFRTYTLEETAEYILRITDKIQRENKDGYAVRMLKNGQNTNNLTGGDGDGETYIEHMQIKMTKQDNITPENIGEIMLSQIPKVSLHTAKAIMKHYTSITNLFISIMKNPEGLDGIKLEMKNGKKRSISYQAKMNILRYLIHNRGENCKTIEVITDTPKHNST